MNNKRFNKFTKTLSNFSNHPMFSKLRKLYIEDDVKQLRTAENWLDKMKITKNGDISKKSIGLVRVRVRVLCTFGLVIRCAIVLKIYFFSWSYFRFFS
jgi:hypothetical protein